MARSRQPDTGTGVGVSFRFPVEAGHVMMFARSIGDPNPIYYDAEYAKTQETGGIVAPPSFLQAHEHFDPDYDRRPRPGEPWFGSGREPVSVRSGPVNWDGGSGFHAEQHFEYHRHPRPGDVLTVETRPGRQWEKQGRRGGKLVFTETITEFRDAEGALVVTARFVGVSTEKPVE